MLSEASVGGLRDCLVVGWLEFGFEFSIWVVVAVSGFVGFGGFS